MRTESEKLKFVIQVGIGTMEIAENLRRNGYPMTSTRRQRRKNTSKRREGFIKETSRYKKRRRILKVCLHVLAPHPKRRHDETDVVIREQQAMMKDHQALMRNQQASILNIDKQLEQIAK